MINRSLVYRAGVLGCAAVLVVGVAGCSKDAESKAQTYLGDTLELGNGKVQTFTTTDDDGNPTEVGFLVDAAALENLPEPHGGHSAGLFASTPLRFSKDAPKSVYDHATFDYVPGGHEPPGIFDKSHFDVHFYMTSPDTIKSIIPSDANFAAKAAKDPESKYIPKDYGLGPIPREAVTVPMMGVHQFDQTTPLIPNEYKFTEILINGTWNGEWIFQEPMITYDYLKSKPSLSADVKQPQAYQHDGYYATKYNVRYNADDDQYAVSMSGLTERTKS